jgi:hypothetical protein
MLGVKEAKEVIKQLQEQQFICSDDLIATNNYVIVKKTGCVTTDKVGNAVREIKKIGGKEE